MFPPLLLLLCFYADDCTTSFEDWPQTQVTDYANCINNAAVGQCIVASAGGSFTAPPDSVITMNASASSVPHTPGAISYQWVQLPNGAATVNLTAANTVEASFTTSEEGIYLFQVTSSWLCREDTATVTITVGSRLIPASLDAEAVVIAPCQPVQLTYSHDGDDRLFIVTKPGIINVVKNGALLPTPFLDISDRVSGNCEGSSEQGLLGMAFHPDYANNGFFYIYYTGTFPGSAGSANDTRVAAYGTDGSNPDLADTSTATLLLSVAQPFTNHNGGQILFGPDDMLYIGLGDGGAGGDPQNNAQNGMALLGKMLRYQTNGLNALTVPPDNPFVGDPSTLDDIWALGLRNPWRFSFDRLTGDLYIGDVGQADWEEVDFQPASSTGGENYGWRLKEGTHCYNPTTNCDPGGLTDPIFDYSSNGGYCTVIGGYVYRGLDIPDLDGFYVYTDWCASGNNSLRSYKILVKLGEAWVGNDLDIYVNNQILNDSVVAFGEDGQGEIYTCHTGGTIRKIVGIRAFKP